MAKATKTPSDYTLTLELSREEAEILFALIGNTTGEKSIPLTNVYQAMKNAGVDAIPLKIEYTKYNTIALS